MQVRADSRSNTNALVAPPGSSGNRHSRRLVYAAMFIDMLGGGLFGPFELLYGHVVLGLPLPAAGLLIAAGAASSIAVGPLAGYAVDRLGARRVVISSNIFGAIGCIALLTDNPIGFAGGIFLLAAAQRAFYGAFSPFVALVAASRDMESWFGRIRSFPYAGLALGAALSGAAFALGQGPGLRLLVLLNGVSFVVAVALLWLAGRRAVNLGQGFEPPPAGYREVLADRANLVLAGLNVLSTMLILAPFVAMPVFVLDVLHQPTWLPGLLAATNTVTVVLGSAVSARLLRGRRRLANLAIVCGVWTVGIGLFLGAAAAPLLVPVGLFAGMVVLGVGEALYAPTADTLPLALAPPLLRGRYAAVHQMAWGVSETVGPALAGYLLATSGFLLWGF